MTRIHGEINRNKVKEEVEKIEKYQEIIKIGKGDLLPWMVVIENIGYQINEDGTVTIKKGLWVSETEFFMYEGESKQLIVRYFSGTGRQPEVIYPAFASSHIEVTDDFVITILDGHWTTGSFYVKYKWSSTFYGSESISILIHITQTYFDIFKDFSAKKLSCSEGNGFSLTNLNNCEWHYYEWYKIGVGHGTEDAMYSADVIVDWSKVNIRPNLKPKTLHLEFGGDNYRDTPKLSIEVRYKDGNKSKKTGSFPNTSIDLQDKEIKEICIHMVRL